MIHEKNLISHYWEFVDRDGDGGWKKIEREEIFSNFFFTL